jgi:hypothetical protein
VTISNFPAALAPIIQQGFLEREFQQAFRSKLAYRAIADRVGIAMGAGETVTKTRAGLKAAVSTPMTPSGNTNLDNGLSVDAWAVEQYTMSMAMYGATMDLNTVTTRVGIVGQFLQNAYANGEQASRSLDELARKALFAAYLGGNTRVRTTLGSPGVAVAVDDVRGFQVAFVNGVQTTLNAGTATLSVTVGSNVYTLNTVAVDGSNVSTAPGGISGVLTFSGNVTVADATAGNTVQAANASAIIRPSGRGNTSLLQATDTLTMSNLLDAVAQMRLNAVPDIGGAFNCYLDPISSRQLFADPDFKQLFQGATSSASVFQAGMVNDFLGLRFMPTTEAYVQAHPSIAGLKVRRPIIAGQGALIEGAFDGIATADAGTGDAIVSMVDGVAMVTRAPLDRLRQIIAQSWYWIGGYTAPTDTTTTSVTVPTATSAAFKRAVTLEHVG